MLGPPVAYLRRFRYLYIRVSPGDATSRRWLTVGAALAVVGAVTAYLLIRAGRDEKQIGQTGSPLVVVVSPDHGRDLQPGDRVRLEALLSSRAGLVIQVRVARTPIDAIEAFAGAADVGLLNLFEYLLARKQYGVEAGLRVLRDAGSSYAGEIVVPAGSEAQALADLAGKTVAYVSPYSTSGFVFPASLLARKGVAVRPHFAGSHDAVLTALRDSRAAAAATYAGAAGRGMRAIAHTAPIPNEPIFFRRGLAAGKRAQVIAAFRSMSASPEGRSLLSRIAGVTGVEPVRDEDYEPVVTEIRAAGKTIEAVVPEGMQLDARSRGIEIAL